MPRRATGRSPATSQTSAPLEITASPWRPTWSKTSSAHRSGRPVTNTTGTSRSSSSASTCWVYADTVLSERTSVPSRSVATSRGVLIRLPTSDNVTVTGSPSSMPTARLTACLTGST